MLKNMYFNFFFSIIYFIFYFYFLDKKILENNSGPAHSRFHYFTLKNLAKQKIKRKARENGAQKARWHKNLKLYFKY